MGASIGVGSTLLAERMRVSRERQDRREALRQQLYADYLSALARVADSLWALGQSPDRADLLVKAHDLWRGGDAYPLRYHVTINAPSHIAAASDTCFRSLRDFRDAVGAGVEGGSPEFTQVQRRYDEALISLHQAMRADLKTQ
ncbi:hypothetical protein [Streptomyces sp. NBC_01361]|uniref:hypothetical protein n=1 Tax=Streptomyces sp. NBC_01361 TaxID=2903838 RepID=UPI002E30A891|nr:hypothetical protein [Streptomyces sp. NBC_01361]